MEEENNNGNWPAAVIERLQAYAERTNKKVGEAANEFKAWLKKEYAVDDINDEDDDILTSWSEMFIIETRNFGGSSRQTSTFVGHIVGIDESIRDYRENIRNKAVSMFRQDSSRAIDEKVIGIVSAKDGVWCVNGEPTKEKVDGDKLPWFGLECDGRNICLLSSGNADSSRNGKPMAPESKSRTLYFLGNDEDNFQTNIRLWKVSLSGDAMKQEYEIGRPVKIQVVLGKKPDSDTVYTNFDFLKTIDYTDSFVDDEDAHLLRGEKFLLNKDMHDLYTDLKDLPDTYDKKKVAWQNGGGYSGPLIIISPIVTRLNTSPNPSDFDQTGRSFRMGVSGFGIDNEITVWVPGRVYDDTHPFEFKDQYGEWKPYAERSKIVIFGRLKMRPYNDDMVPSITAYGIYVPPRTARPGVTGGDTSLEQFGGDQ
jgi:hypothetical protein